jgi:transcription initiation factor IIE alpha subunit
MHDAGDDFEGIEFSCPMCGAALGGYVRHCPECGADLAELYSARYRPKTSRAMRAIAFIALGGIVVLILLVAIACLRR